MKGLLKLFRGKCRRCEEKDELIAMLRLVLGDIVEHTTCPETSDVARAYSEESYEGKPENDGYCPHGFKDWDACGVCCH